VQAHTTPAAPAVTAIGAVTELSPEEHMTGMLTAREMEYAAASVGVAYQFSPRGLFFSAYKIQKYDEGSGQYRMLLYLFDQPENSGLCRTRAFATLCLDDISTLLFKQLCKPHL
jgi:predicted porin